MIFRCVLLYCAVSVIIHGTVDAISSEDSVKIHDAMKPFVTQCVQEFGVSEEKVTEMKKKGNADGVDPCFIACVFHKTGIIDNKGLYDAEKSVELTKPFITNEDDMKIIEKVAQDCSKVNDAEVSDGDKGCDRSKLVFACMIEHKDEINLDVD